VKQSRNNRNGNKTKYDVDQLMLTHTYGALADIRRGIANSKEDIERRTALLGLIAQSDHAQKTWLYLDDYFKQINLTRKEFADDHWWMKIQSSTGETRLQELALQFMRNGRSLPTELEQYADYGQLILIVKEENEASLAKETEEWMFPPAPSHLDETTSRFNILFDPVKEDAELNEYTLNVRFQLSRPRLGRRCRHLEKLRDMLS